MAVWLRTVDEFMTLTPEQKEWIELLESITEPGRSILRPLDTPEDRVDFLRTVCHDCLHHSETVANVEQFGMPDPLSSG